ncbi:suppressor of loss of ypt1, partial [Entomortierella beljakovae]
MKEEDDEALHNDMEFFLKLKFVTIEQPHLEQPSGAMAAAVTASTLPLGQQHHHLQSSKSHPSSTSPSQSRLQSSHQEHQSTGAAALLEALDDNHSANNINSNTNGHVTNVGLPTYTRAPLTQQPPHRQSSPGPNSKFAPANNATNGSTSSSMTTATSQSSTFGGRSHVQVHQQHYQYQQHQHDLLLEDEKELQKKNAGPAIPGSGRVSTFLPPALNQSLIKAVQTAKDVVNSPSSPHSKMSLPRLPIIAEGGGGNNSRTTSAFAPRSTWRSQLNTGSIVENLRLPATCLLWYLSSAVTNNLGKQIMNQFRYPVTLTFVQFWFVSIFCFISSAVFNMARIHRPTAAIIKMTAPLVGFQVVGHVFSSIAISRVPLS